MKKTICVILTVMLLGGCVFAFAGCNDDDYGRELVKDGTFDSGNYYWYISREIDSSKDGTTISKTEGENPYLVLNNGSNAGNYVKV